MQPEATEPSRRRCFRPELFCLLAALLFATGSVSGASLTASFNTQFLQVGQQATLSLTFDGVTPDAAPPAPKIENAQVYQQNSRSVAWSSGANGVRSVQVSFSYLVMPLKAGELTVPPVTAVVAGQQLVSPSVTIKVLTADQVDQAQAAALEKLAWVTIELPKQEAYLGEVVAAQIQIYATGVENLNLHQFKAEGFTLGRATHTTQMREMVNNVGYHKVTFHMPIAGRKIGRLPVGPAECTLAVHVPLDARGRTDPFSPLDVFGRSQTKNMRITSPVKELTILPLPTNDVPAHFNGAVGEFTMNVTAGPTTLAAGDPITYKVEIQARGTLDDLNLPEQDGWREFKTYPPTSQILQKDPLGMSGTKLFEQIVVPAHAEIKELPPFHFSYFDPVARQYRTLTHPAIPLKIKPNTGPAAQLAGTAGMPVTQPEPEKPRADIAHIEPRLGTLASTTALIQRPWFYLLQLVPVAAWLGALAWRRHQAALARDPRLRRRKQVEQLVQTGLKELRLHAGQGDTAAFYETTLRLLKEQLGERLDLPGVSITEDVIEQRLHGRGLPGDALRRLHELFQTCNQARYAGQQSVSDLHHSLAELETLVKELKGMRVP